MDSKKKKQLSRKNFLEALRELSGGYKSPSADSLRGLSRSSGQQIFGANQGDENNESSFNQEKKEFQWSGQEFTSLKQQERVIFKKAEQEVRLQIQAIQTELAKLIRVTQKLTKEVRTAATQAPANPGVYHLNFLEKLRAFIIFLRKNVADSAQWLEACNQKAKKKGGYWHQVKKSGAKFMLSQERSVATQTG